MFCGGQWWNCKQYPAVSVLNSHGSDIIKLQSFSCKGENLLKHNFRMIGSSVFLPCSMNCTLEIWSCPSLAQSLLCVLAQNLWHGPHCSLRNFIWCSGFWNLFLPKLFESREVSKCYKVVYYLICLRGNHLVPAGPVHQRPVHVLAADGAKWCQQSLIMYI